MNNLAKRRRREKRFRLYGLIFVSIALAIVALLMGSIIYKGASAFVHTNIVAEVDLSLQALDITSTDEINDGNFRNAVYQAIYRIFPDIKTYAQKRKLRYLISDDSSIHLKQHVLDNPQIIGKKIEFHFIASDHVDLMVKGKIDIDTPEEERIIGDLEVSWIKDLTDQDKIYKSFNTTFLTAGDSRNPEDAGVLGALMGSFWVLLIAFVLSFTIGVAAAIYLEEFGKKGFIYDVIEININNLAAVPSIIFGLLGLIVFIGFFGMPRSIALVGGFVLTLMTLPTIVISARAALKSVPSEIRQAAMGLGASKTQVVFHHVIPSAMSGILTGSIIGMAQALGESAPLLMIGMVAFIVDIPQSITDVATTLPVQIYLWADSPELAFQEKTYGAILVLLFFLVLINLSSVYLREKLEKKW